MPLEVLHQLQDGILEYNGQGLHHRDEPMQQRPDGMYNECLALLRELPASAMSTGVLGGGVLQFAMVPMNFCVPIPLPITSRGYGQRRQAMPRRSVCAHMMVRPITPRFDRRRKAGEDSSYLYLCSNETIGGIQWKAFPDTGTVPLIADMSSDFFSRPVPVDQFSMIYAGVQKNLGPAGATVVIMKKSLLDKQNHNLPAYLDYSNHDKNDGLYNTPPVFSIWAVKLVLE